MFHNLKYDLYAMAKQLFHITSLCKKEGTIYGCVISHRNKNICLKDSYKLISHPLSSFQKMFDLEEGKLERIPYTFYTVRLFDNNIVSRDEFERHLRPPYKLKDEVDGEYREMIRKEREDGCPNFFVDDDQIDCLAYYKMYHRFDCIVLAKGMFTYRQRVADFARESQGKVVDVFRFYTASSFGEPILQEMECTRYKATLGLGR